MMSCLVNIGRDGRLKITVWVSPLGCSFAYWWRFLVGANLPIANITSCSYEINNVLSDDSVSDCPTLVFRASSRKSRGLGFASTSTHVRIPHKSSATGHSILYDNLLSHRFISYYHTTPKNMMPDNQKPHTPTYQVVYHLNSNCTALSLMVRILFMRNRFRFIFKISGLRRYAANHDQKYCTSSAPT